MKRQTLLLISVIILIAISQQAKAQSSLKVNALADTTIYDDKLPFEGHVYKFPLSPLSQAEYTRSTINSQHQV